MMGFEVLPDAAVFESTEQAVHVAFLVLAQEAVQDAPLRKALIRAMESIPLTNNQQHWLDELRGAKGTVNFGGLDGNEVRAQCAMITQAVKSRLPRPEMWVLQAKYGQTDFEDIPAGPMSPDDQLPALPLPRRRFAFSVERIEAIKGLSDWFRPLFPNIAPLAIDCMLGRLFANHKELDISSRDIAESFGGNHTRYLRASRKMQQHIRDLEQLAMRRLDGFFREHAVVQNQY